MVEISRNCDSQVELLLMENQNKHSSFTWPADTRYQICVRMDRDGDSRHLFFFFLNTALLCESDSIQSDSQHVDCLVELFFHPPIVSATAALFTRFHLLSQPCALGHLEFFNVLITPLVHPSKSLTAGLFLCYERSLICLVATDIFIWGSRV